MNKQDDKNFYKEVDVVYTPINLATDSRMGQKCTILVPSFLKTANVLLKTCNNQPRLMIAVRFTINNQPSLEFRTRS